MADRFTGSDHTIDALLQRLDDMERRLRLVESQGGGPVPPPAAPPVRPAPFAAAGRFNPLTTASLAGRTSLVLAGGYLLRALTASAILPLWLGIGLGLIYAVAWIAMADRAAAKGRSASAAFHAAAAAGVACPLLYEATAHFHAMDPWTLTIDLTAIVALGIAVGWYRWVESIVWIFTVASIATVIALMRASATPAPFGVHLIALVALTYWVSHARPWWRERWLAALVADGVMLTLAVGAAAPAPHPQLAIVAAVGVALFAVSVGSFTARLLALGGAVRPFEMFQSAAALLVGYGGAAWIVRGAGLETFGFAAAALAIGGLAYAIAFGGAVGRRNFTYFALLAIAMVIAGGILLFRPDAAVVLWIALALGATALGKRLANVMLNAQGTAYLFAAAAASGLLLLAGRGLLGESMPARADTAPIALLTLAAAIACGAMSPVSIRWFSGTAIATIAGRRRAIRAPRTVTLALVALTVCGVIVVWLAPAAGAARAWGAIATIRTIVLAAAVVVLALVAGRARVVEAGWLVYPLLVATGLKILLEDLRRSDPGLLFVTLVVYGTVLIVAPRIAHRGEAPA